MRSKKEIRGETVNAEEREQGGVSPDIYSIASDEICWFLQMEARRALALVAQVCRCDHPIFRAGAWMLPM